MDSKATNIRMGITTTKNFRHLYHCPPSFSHLPPTLTDISERNNAVNLIGHWCHNFGATIQGDPRPLIVFHF